MILIADSGSTKADWMCIQDGKIGQKVSTKGFNPNAWTTDEIIAELEGDFQQKMPLSSIEKVIFYGSGCWGPCRKKIVADALKVIFPSSIVEVEHDLLASARATCGDEPGIACILGTGSNSVLYDGKIEVDNVTNLGHLAGDEGSASHIGRKLLQAYFYRELPEELEQSFEILTPGGREEVLNRLYKNPRPNLYLASFSRFINVHKKHLVIWNLVKESFTEFIRRHVCKYEGHQHLPIHFVGSIAYYYSDILAEVLAEEGLHLGQIIKQPIHNLVAYHVQMEMA